MIRLIILALIVYGLVKIWRKFTRISNLPKAHAQVSASNEMTACAKCSTFVLTSETISANGQLFCSESCSKGENL